MGKVPRLLEAQATKNAGWVLKSTVQSGTALFLSVILETSLKGPSFQKKLRTSENLSLSGRLNLAVQRHLVFKVDKKSEHPFTEQGKVKLYIHI